MMGKRKRDELGVRTVPYVSNLDCPILVSVPDGSHNTGNRSTLVYSSAIIDNPLHGGSRSTSRSTTVAFYRYNSHHNLFPLSPRLLRPSLSPRNFLARLQTLFVSRPRWQRLRIAAGITQ